MIAMMATNDHHYGSLFTMMPIADVTVAISEPKRRLPTHPEGAAYGQQPVDSVLATKTSSATSVGSMLPRLDF